MFKVLIVGGGGREHALAWKCASSPRVTEVLVAPGNAGTATEPKVRNVAVNAEDVAGLVALAQAEKIDLTIIGPEAPLVLGVVDAFEAAGLRCFGPRKAPAQLEGSKAFTKEFLKRHGIPTAAYATFTRDNFDANWVRRQRMPIVVKASGLAAGKGVVIVDSAECRHFVSHGITGTADMEVHVAVRPEKVDIRTDPPEAGDYDNPRELGYNCARGTVRDVAYLGSQTIYHVRLESGMVVKVSKSNDARHDERRLEAGASVHVWWWGSDVVVLTQ